MVFVVTPTQAPRPGHGALGFRVQRWTPLSVGFTSGLSGLIALLAFAPVLLSENTQTNLIQLYFLVILAVMWNALAGYGGLVSIGQQAFIGLGAYAAVFFAVQHGLNPYTSMLLGTLVAGLVAIPVACVVLWLRNGAFAIATWVIAEAFAILVSLDPNPAIGGGTGTSEVLPFTFRYDPTQRLHYTYWAALGAVTVLLVLVFVLLRSRLGGSLQAIRDDEEAASAVGVRVLLGKGVLFIVAALGCAAAGTVILAWQLSIQPLGPDSIFGVNWTAKMIFMVLVGGLGTFEGPIIGAVLLYVLQIYVTTDGVWYFVMLGGIAIGFALLLPRGIWGTIQERFNVQLLPVGYRLRTGTGR
jgi:branched-chain amino acid transport system permease protein